MCTKRHHWILLEVFNSGTLFSFMFYYLQLNLLTVPEQTRSPFYPPTFQQKAEISLQGDQTEVICGIFTKIFWSNKSNTFPPSLSQVLNTGEWISHEQCNNKTMASSAKWRVLKTSYAWRSRQIFIFEFRSRLHPKPVKAWNFIIREVRRVRFRPGVGGRKKGYSRGYKIAAVPIMRGQLP